MAGPSVGLNNHDELFKKFYVPLAEAAVHTATPLMMRTKQIDGWTGKDITGAAILSMGGGVGNDVIPVASTRASGSITYTPKALWATSVLDWEAVVSSADDRGAFLDVTKSEIESTMLAFTNNMSRQYNGKSSGIIGTLDGTAPIDNGDGTWTFIVSSTSWFYPNWEVGNVINFHTNTDPFEITRIAKTTRAITVNRRQGSFDPSTLTNQNLFMQNSAGKELTGLGDIEDAVDDGVATLYGLRVQPRWQAYRQDGGAKPLIPDMLTEVVEMMHEDNGEAPNLIEMNSVQYTALANQLEGQKEYTQLKPRDERYADMGWKGIGLTTRYGTIAMITDRFCPKDKVRFLNDDYMEFRKRPRWGWLTFDGKQYLRDFNEGERPKYKANYGGFGQFYHHPGRMGVLYNLEVPAIGS